MDRGPGPRSGPPAFEVIALGVGDTFSERHHPTALLLVAGDFHLAVDVPDGYRRVLRDASLRGAGPLDLAAIQDVLLTHVHGDHMNGLEGVGFWKRFAEGRRPRLHAAPEVLEGLWERRLALPMGRLRTPAGFQDLALEDYFDARPLVPGIPHALGPFQVELRATRHHVPTFALRASCQGRTLAYSSDTAFDPDLVTWLSSADLVLHETNRGPAHTPAEDLSALPAELRARMRLVHYPDDLDLAAVPIAPLREGDRLVV